MAARLDKSVVAQHNQEWDIFCFHSHDTLCNIYTLAAVYLRVIHSSLQHLHALHLFFCMQLSVNLCIS